MCVYIYLYVLTEFNNMFLPSTDINLLKSRRTSQFSRVLCDLVNLISFNEKIGIMFCDISEALYAYRLFLGDHQLASLQKYICSGGWSWF